MAKGRKANSELSTHLHKRPSLLQHKKMAALYNHARSNSLPSRSHPFVTEFDEHLCRLKASEATSSSSSSISHKLSGLQDLQECVEKFLLLPLTQQALAQECADKWISELLDRSLRLLDVCGIIKDAMLQTKEYTHELQSIMRRRRGDDKSFMSEVKKYLTSRKDIKKATNKALKVKESKCTDKNHETPAVVSMLIELDALTATVFESLLSFIAGSNLRSKSSPWSLVSKLVQSKRVACEGMEVVEMNELEKVDAALQSLISHKTRKSDYTKQVENVQNVLQELEISIQDIEEGLECLFRRLIKARVSLLNIFNH